jgi:Flp pilus assembly secretin CpaC
LNTGRARLDTIYYREFTNFTITSMLAAPFIGDPTCVRAGGGESGRDAIFRMDDTRLRGDRSKSGVSKMIDLHKAFLTFLIGCTISGVAWAQQESEMHVLMLGHATLFKTDQSFTNIVIGDPKIVDVSATSDRTATLTALSTGATNVLFLDALGNPISEFEVVVSQPQQSLVRVHSKSSGLMGFVSYRCGPTFCDFIEEKISQEAAQQRQEETTTVTTNPDGSQSTTKTNTQRGIYFAPPRQQ